MVLGLEEGLVECATVCVKSVVILKSRPTGEEFFAAATMINWHESILGMNLGWSHIDLDLEKMFKNFVKIWKKCR